MNDLNPTPQAVSSVTETEQGSCLLAGAALLIALAALGGSLALSLGLNLRACPLCFYQRTFAMCVAAVLGMGLLLGLGRGGRLSLLALPMAMGGLGVALFHVFLEWTGKLECPAGLLAMGTAPLQSLAVFLVLFAVLLADVLLNLKRQHIGRLVSVAALLLGGLLVVASTIANPPPPPRPGAPYRDPPDVCRPPYQAPQ